MENHEDYPISTKKKWKHGVLNLNLNDLNWRLQFNDPARYQDFSDYCKYRKLSIVIFLISFLCLFLFSPSYIVVISYASRSSEFCYGAVLLILNLVIGACGLLIFYNQMVQSNSPIDTHVLLLQRIVIFTSWIGVIVISPATMIITDCTNYPKQFGDYLPGWNCNNSETDPFPMLLFIPVFALMCMNEPRFDIILFVWITSSLCYFIIYMHSANTHNAYLICIWTILGMLVLANTHIHRLSNFLTNRQLKIALLENEYLAEQTRIFELQQMIGNVAHDLKTPLSSFMSGMDYIHQSMCDFEQRLYSDTVDHIYLQETVYGIRQCLQGLKNTNAFMLMTINRCIDYTKASRGLKLTPKNETILLLDVLQLPLNCMRNIQEKVTIELNPLPADLCTHLITDKQWLQENLLCLLSNAVKYSSKGRVTITAQICHINDIKSSIYTQPKPVHTPCPQERPYFLNGKDSMKDGTVSTRSRGESEYGEFGSASFLEHRGDYSNDSIMDHCILSFSSSSSRKKYRKSRNQFARVVPTTTSYNYLTTTKENELEEEDELEDDFVLPSDSSLASIRTHNPKAPSNAMKNQIAGNYQYFLRFDVEDCGIGISDEAMEGLFNPFKQAQRLAGGTGLGLYSLSKRMEAIHGYFGVAHRKDGQQGSVFWFAIPYIPDTPSAELYHHHLYDNTDRPFTLQHPELSCLSHSHDSLSSFLDIPMTILPPPSSLPVIPFAIPPPIDTYWATNNSNHQPQPQTPIVARSLLSSSPKNMKRIHIVANMHHSTPITTITATTSTSTAATTAICIPQDIMGMPTSPENIIPDTSPHYTQDETTEEERRRNNNAALHVLLVDDSPTILKMVSLMLSKHFYHITTAENGDIAIQLLEEQWKIGKRYDCIVMDLQMPVMDGLEATRRIRRLEKEHCRCSSSSQYSPPTLVEVEEHETTKTNTCCSSARQKEIIIAMSANHDEETIEQTRQVGFDAFIAKPFSMDTLQEIIHKFIPS